MHHIVQSYTILRLILYTILYTTRKSRHIAQGSMSVYCVARSKHMLRGVCAKKHKKHATRVCKRSLSHTLRSAFIFMRYNRYTTCTGAIQSPKRAPKLVCKLQVHACFLVKQMHYVATKGEVNDVARLKHRRIFAFELCGLRKDDAFAAKGLYVQIYR